MATTSTAPPAPASPAPAPRAPGGSARGGRPVLRYVLLTLLALVFVARCCSCW